MSKLTDLLKDGEVKTLYRRSWDNDNNGLVLLTLDAGSDVVTQHTWVAGNYPYSEVVTLTVCEAIADDWEVASIDDMLAVGLVE